MKHLVVLLALVALLVSPALAQSDAEVKIKTSSQCDSCKKRIEKSVSLEPGVKSVVLDLETHTLTVVYKKDKTDVEKLKKAVSKTGYDADNLPADEKAYKKLPECCQKGGHDH